MYSLEQSLNLICWYNGHTKTFLNLAEELKSYNEKKNFIGNINVIQKNILCGCYW